MEYMSSQPPNSTSTTKKSPQSRSTYLPEIQKTRENILGYCHQKNRPVTIGEISLHLGWWASLSKTQELLSGMVEFGMLEIVPGTWTDSEMFRIPVKASEKGSKSDRQPTGVASNMLWLSKREKPRVLLDADGVIADFLGASIPIMNTLSGKTWEADHFVDWDLFETVGREHEKAFYQQLTDSPGWCREIPLYEGSVEGVKTLESISDVYIVTSPMYSFPTWAAERTAWLKHHFDIHHQRVVHTSAKHLCVGDILIDDRPANLESWLAAHPGGVAMLWSQPYNRNAVVPGTIRVHSWAEVHQLIKEPKRILAHFMTKPVRQPRDYR